VVLTGAVALVTVVGAITGASLKADKEAVTQRQKAQEMPVAERVAMIDARRAELLRAKAGLERKLERLQARMGGEAAAKEGSQQRN
jgi:Ribonuclease G/E